MNLVRLPKVTIMIDPFTLSLILIVVLSSFGLSIGLAMICGSSIYLLIKGFDPSIAAETLLQGMFDSYTLLAIPLFVLAADIMNVGSLADRLLRFCQALVGRYRGGLGYVNVVSAIIFSGMSGSAVADAVGMGRIIINMMTKDGKYTPSYAAAITAAAATIGPIIPPSIPMVIYALVSDQSVGYLFAAGMAPGLLMGLMIGVINWWVARRRNFPVDEGVPLSEIAARYLQCYPGANAARYFAWWYLWWRHDADGSRCSCRFLRAACFGLLLPFGLRPAILQDAPQQFALDCIRWHSDCRCADLQLRDCARGYPQHHCRRS